jgi:para-aminobenzoate synthetase component 1
VPELLEVCEPHGAFARLEGWLTDRGFFGPESDGLVAELYLGYGLSEAIRRGTMPPPPEPCRPLPLAACRVGADAGSGSRGSYGIGPWERTWTGAEYGAAVEEVRTAIARGDVYQVNLVQHLRAPFSGDPRELARRLRVLRPLQPRPFVTDTWSVISASPELFLSRRGDRLSTRPIKGTRPRGAAAELRDSAKDAAEHVMIVDLERNDLSRVCEAGSIHWPELMETQALAGVEHMVSTVEGTLRPGAGLGEILEATFPGGSVTGAPKIAAVDLIAELEPVGRGASMGAIGRVHGNGDVDLALTIRTFAIAEGSIHLWVGGGVVWDSDPSAEVEESWTKASPLLEAAGSRMLEAALS